MSVNCTLETLVLEGFQCIRDRTTIDFSPITLLYGPNSAGKSALLDALDIVRRIADPTASGNEAVQQELEDTLMRWAHRPTPTQAPPGTPMGPMELGVSVSTPLVRLPVTEFYDQFEPEGPLASWMFNRDSPRLIGMSHRFTGLRAENHEVTYSVDAQWVMRCRNSGGATVELNFEHPLLAGPTGFKDELLAGWTRPFQLDLLQPDKDEGVPWLFSSDGHAVTDFGVSYVADFRPPYRIARARAADGFTSGLPEAWVQPMAFLIELFIEVVTDSVFEALSLARIDGERLPPFRDGLRATVPPYLRGLQVNSVHSAVAALLASHAYRTRPPGTTVGSEPDLADWVDRCLQDHLFHDSGYLVSPRVNLTLDISRGELGRSDFGLGRSARRPMGGVAPNEEIVVYLMRYLEHVKAQGSTVLNGTMELELMLLDNHGRWLRLADVGSGIGYVLPCLVAWWYPLSLVAQPELHLHPALQAELGDVLLDAVQAGRQLIIESHSEHMLLRLLRRVRESALGEGAPAGRSLRPNGLAIYYFDPQGDGATAVKQIRVSTQGDLLDRWPNGFFPERAKELLG